jgi:hypothetical protein
VASQERTRALITRTGGEQHYTEQHYTEQRYTEQHYTAQSNATQSNITQSNTTQSNTTKSNATKRTHALPTSIGGEQHKTEARRAERREQQCHRVPPQGRATYTSTTASNTTATADADAADVDVDVVVAVTEARDEGTRRLRLGKRDCSCRERGLHC